MSQIIFRDLYCEQCSLQFDKKYVYDLHLSLVHGQEIKVKTESTTCEENIEDFQKNEKVLSDKSFKCDKSFVKSKQNLKSHIESVNEKKQAF